LLQSARNPMIMVGSGALNAAPEILALAERLQAPVVSWRGGRGIVGDDHYLGFNCVSGHKRWRETDVLIGIGCRLELQWFRWPDQPKGLKIINLDIDPTQMTRTNPAVGLIADARLGTQKLVSSLERLGVQAPSRKEEFEVIKKQAWCEVQKITPHVQYLQAIRSVLPRDGFLVEEICQAGFTCAFGFPVYEPRTFVTCGHQGNLGFGYPTALGVKAGNPGKAVVAITGDGGFQFGLQELATAVQYGLNVVVVLFNNNAFGNVLRDQQRLFGRTLGSKLNNPDFMKLAEAYGMRGYRAHSAEQLSKTLEQALGANAPALIEVPVDLQTECSPWEFLMPRPQDH